MWSSHITSFFQSDSLDVHHSVCHTLVNFTLDWNDHKGTGVFLSKIVSIPLPRLTKLEPEIAGLSSHQFHSPGPLHLYIKQVEGHWNNRLRNGHWVTCSIATHRVKHITRPPFLQIMACHLFGTKPSSEPKLAYYWLDHWNKFRGNLNQIEIIKTHLKIWSVKWPLRLVTVHFCRMKQCMDSTPYQYCWSRLSLFVLSLRNGWRK